MKHTSIPLNCPCEVIDVTPLNPLISKCQIKVCYVGDKPNRNGSVITKEVAREMANSLPGSPIVGFYNEQTEDFEEHNRDIMFEDGELKFKDITKSYGFVDLSAKVWFQKFIDDNATEHEYLMTEGYLWTEQYPEAKRIIEKGNNQSMELDEKSIKAHWTEIEKDGPEFFIINEAIISKLCILGEDYEPCFEGSQISKVKFSFDDSFMNEFRLMVNQVKEYLNEGGTQMEQELENLEVVSEVEEESAAPAEETVETEPEAPVVEEIAQEEEETEEIEENSETIEEEEDKTVEYNLEENQEYIELKNNYSVLKNNYNEVVSQKSALETEVEELREFKSRVEKVEKQKMIDSFSMLTDDEKLEVVTKIDEYSLEEIEAKLSVICVRNKKVELNHTKEEKGTTSYSLDGADFSDSTPAWIRAVKEVQGNM